MKHLKVFGILLLVFIIISCSNNKNNIPGDVVNNPNTAQGEVDKSVLPVIEFDKIEHDFGTIIEGTIVSYTFKFKNTGKGPLIITNAKASCGCTVPKWPRQPIEPGESGEIKVSFNSKNRGGSNNNKAITVLANTQPPTTVLRIKAIVK